LGTRRTDCCLSALRLSVKSALRPMAIPDLASPTCCVTHALPPFPCDRFPGGPGPGPGPVSGALVAKDAPREHSALAAEHLVAALRILSRVVAPDARRLREVALPPSLHPGLLNSLSPSFVPSPLPPRLVFSRASYQFNWLIYLTHRTSNGTILQWFYVVYQEGIHNCANRFGWSGNSEAAPTPIMCASVPRDAAVRGAFFPPVPRCRER